MATGRVDKVFGASTDYSTFGIYGSELGKKDSNRRVKRGDGEGRGARARCGRRGTEQHRRPAKGHSQPSPPMDYAWREAGGDDDALALNPAWKTDGILSVDSGGGGVSPSDMV
ncbi:urease accessory protein UreG [Striga asiatica]|uniref:Urease accessory protein UreG n=1 Tax=Striga asiatica TaxID=4170 RepID=A0A5A7QVZ8_STRAF|nr:urease accessory protein UreG [Striga asiatica]